MDLVNTGKVTDTEDRDTDDCPQPIFFGESDIAEHCASCGEYLYGEDPEEEEGRLGRGKDSEDTEDTEDTEDPEDGDTLAL